MPLFTVILDYRGGCYIWQGQAPDVADVMRRWIEEVDLDEIHGLTGKVIAAVEAAGRSARRFPSIAPWECGVPVDPCVARTRS